MSFNNLSLGNANKSSNIDLDKLKSGVSRKDFESDVKSLALFDAYDTNKNGYIEDNELSLFKEKLSEFAGDDKNLSKFEARKMMKAEQERQAQDAQQKGQEASLSKHKIKLDDVNSFTTKLAELGNESKVKSSRVENEQRILEYEDGSQETINKDGSKIITTIGGGVKTVKSLNSEGKKIKEEKTNDEDGSVETLLYGDDNKLQSHTKVKGNVVSEFGVEAPNHGRLLKETSGEGENKVISTYSYKDANNFVKTTDSKNTKVIETVANGEVATTEIISYDENNQRNTSVLQNSDGTRTESLYKNNKVIQEQITDAEGNKRETSFNENGYKLSQTFTSKDGEVSTAKYDGNGNTLVTVQNGETIGQLAQKFNKSSSEIISTNKGKILRNEDGQAYLKVGAEISISGEVPPTNQALKGRKTADVAKNEYVNTRVDQYSKNFKPNENDKVNTTIEKDYDSWYQYTKEFLQKNEGVEEPSEHQITESSFALRSLNPGVEKPTKGSVIVRLKTTSEHQADQIAEAKSKARKGLVEQFEKESVEAQKSFTEGLKDDDIFEKTADVVAHLWNNELTGYTTGNTESYIQSKLDASKVENTALKAAAMEGEDAFAAKFKELYGVEYSKEKIDAYAAEKAEYQRLESISIAADNMTESLDDSYNRFMKAQMHYRDQGRKTGMADPREVNNEIYQLKNIMENKFQFSDEFVKGVMDNLPPESDWNGRISYINQLTTFLKTEAQNYKKAALGDTSLEARKEKLDENYKSTFGSKSNFEEMIPDYRKSQEQGGKVVKAGVEIAAYVALAAATGGATTGMAGFLASPVGKGIATAVISSGLDAASLATDGHEHTDQEIADMLVKATVKGATVTVGASAGSVYKSVATAMGKNANSLGHKALSSVIQEESKGIITGADQSDILLGAALGVGGDKLGASSKPTAEFLKRSFKATAKLMLE